MANNKPDLWRYLKNYVTAPYRNNPESTAAVAAWCDGLEAYRSEGLDLSLCRIEHNAHPSARFTAFCLNEQMFISTSPYVLFVPYPSTSPFSNSDKQVGVWVHDLGIPDKAFIDLYETEIQTVQAKGKPFVQVSAVIPESRSAYFKALNTQRLMALQAGTQISLGATQANPESYLLKIACDTPHMMDPHRDSRSSINPVNLWGRVTLTGLKGNGSTYLIGPEENIAIALPANIVASHLGFKYYGALHDLCETMGALHNATPHSGGRAILLAETHLEEFVPEVGVPSPWRVKPLVQALSRA